MQAVLADNRVVSGTGELTGLFRELEGADNLLKSSIENRIVSFGETAIDFLVDKLVASRGTQRGVAAMCLIRIGEASINALRKLGAGNKSYAWIANYLIKEIECSL